MYRLVQARLISRIRVASKRLDNLLFFLLKNNSVLRIYPCMAPSRIIIFHISEPVITVIGNSEELKFENQLWLDGCTYRKLPVSWEVTVFPDII